MQVMMLVMQPHIWLTPIAPERMLACSRRRMHHVQNANLQLKLASQADCWGVGSRLMSHPQGA